MYLLQGQLKDSIENPKHKPIQCRQSGHSNESIYTGGDLEKIEGDWAGTEQLGLADTKRDVEKSQADKTSKKFDRLLTRRTTRSIQPRYKLRSMYNKYTDAMRSGSPIRRIHARTLRRRKLKYVSPLSKPGYLTFGSPSNPVKLDKVKFKPLPNIGHRVEKAELNDQLSNRRTYWSGNYEDPDGMNNVMLVDEYLRTHRSPDRRSDTTVHLSLDSKLKPVVPRLFSSDLQNSEVAAKYSVDEFTTFSDRGIQRDRGQQNNRRSVDGIQLNGFRLNAENRHHGQKRQRNCDDNPDNVLVHDIELLNISSQNEDHISNRKAKHKGKTHRQHQRITKDGVREIQIYIPTAEREESFSSEICSNTDEMHQEIYAAKKKFIKERQNERMQKVDVETLRMNQRHEDILLGRDFPKKRDKKQVSFRDFKCAPNDISEDGVAISVNKLDNIITRNKLPKLKYQIVPNYQMNKEEGLGTNDFLSSPIQDIGQNAIPNFMISNFSKNSNCNNSVDTDEMGENYDIETSYLKPQDNAMDVRETNKTHKVSPLHEGQHSGNLHIPEIRMIAATPTFKETESEKKE